MLLYTLILTYTTHSGLIDVCYNTAVTMCVTATPRACVLARSCTASRQYSDICKHAFLQSTTISLLTCRGCLIADVRRRRRRTCMPYSIPMLNHTSGASSMRSFYLFFYHSKPLLDWLSWLPVFKHRI